MNGVSISGGVTIDNLVVRELTDDELLEQRRQLLRAYGRLGYLRLPVWPSRAIIGPYGVRWEAIR